ncbi:hypothetical protein, partial [Salmonella sp. M265]|uniref:hypothetical protein n=1 Tax=Salmonella sp. M265 TaxID=3240301 RepID=UPI00352B2787
MQASKALLAALALGITGLAQAADDIDDVRVIAGCPLDPGARCAKADLRGADLRIDSFKGFGQELKNLTVDLARQER